MWSRSATQAAVVSFWLLNKRMLDLSGLALCRSDREESWSERVGYRRQMFCFVIFGFFLLLKINQEKWTDCVCVFLFCEGSIHELAGCGSLSPLTMPRSSNKTGVNRRSIDKTNEKNSEMYVYTNDNGRQKRRGEDEEEWDCGTNL